MFDDQPQNQPAPPANLPQEPASPSLQRGEPADMFAEVEKAVNGPVAPAAAAAPNALAAGLLKPKSAEGLMPDSGAPSESTAPSEGSATPVTYATKAPILGKIIFIVIILLVIGGVAYGAWWGYNNFIKVKPESVSDESVLPPSPETGEADQTTPEPAANLPANEAASQPAGEANVITTSPTGDAGADIKNKSILFGEQMDTDKDDVPDSVETKYGTDPKKPDTDDDGLTDGEEITFFGTDPTKKDTDGDNLSDSDEVNKWHTNPLNSDTDGDTFADGLEVSRGYNPLGPGKLSNSASSSSTPSASATSSS
ncbi:MAG: hypothetical protein Q7K39_01305 [Candidatus Magasanikbacteria bacterium]|nr:hypothetical protein [Candidatus Magasanikbacteria bacterium]